MEVIKNGIEYEFYLDIEKAIEIEEKKGVNIFDAMDEITTAKGNPSLSGMNNLCKVLLGYPLPDLVQKGFTVKELVGEGGIILKVIEESGFISAMKDGDTSPEVEEEISVPELKSLGDRAE